MVHNRLPIAILGDGDFLMGVTALWTGVHYRVPLLVIVANNRSFYNDELHQERMAKQRGRLVANKWIGQQMSGPEIDLAGLARAQGATAFGPVRTWDDLALPSPRRGARSKRRTRGRRCLGRTRLRIRRRGGDDKAGGKIRTNR